MLLLAAALLIALEIKFASHGVLAAAGIGALVFGLATLVDGPIDEMRIHAGTAIAAGLGFGIVTFALAWIAMRARRNKVLTGSDAMIGRQAFVRAVYEAAGTGQVEVRGELWQARTADALTLGEPVQVKAVDGLVLVVEHARPN